MKLDLKDQKILHALEFDARAPISKIAKKVGLSKEVTNYRIKRLEKKGIIDCYRTLFNLFNLDKDYYVLLFKIKDYHSLESKILGYLKNLKRRSRVILCDGAWNLIITMRANSMQQLIHDINGFLDKYGESIESKQIIFVKEMFISKCYFLYNNIDKDYREMIHIKKDPNKREPLKKLERELSLKLAVNPRCALNTLASKLNVDVKTIKKYMARLNKDNFVACYRTYINTEKLGFKRFKVFISFRNLSKENDEILGYLKCSRNIPVLYTCFGMADLVFEILVLDIGDLFKFLKDLSIKYSSKIKEYSFLPIIKYESKPD